MSITPTDPFESVTQSVTATSTAVICSGGRERTQAVPAEPRTQRGDRAGGDGHAVAA